GQITFSDLTTMNSTQSSIYANVQRPGIADDATARGGSITIGSSDTTNIDLTGTTITASTFTSARGQTIGNAGDITITGKDITITGGSISSLAGPESSRAGGIITLNGNQIALTNTSFSSYNDSQGAGPPSGNGAIILQGLASTEMTPTTAHS